MPNDMAILRPVSKQAHAMTVTLKNGYVTHGLSWINAIPNSVSKWY